MEILETYLPQDRRRALASETSIPERAVGAVLFADISGFTPLTEAFLRRVGARRGAEELTSQLNRVYDALIAQIEKFGGSVITFSGDAVTCWFPETRAALHAAYALQHAMRDFAAIPLPDGATAALTIKVTVASGMVRRFVVGDPQIRRIDVMVGSTVARTAIAEHLSHPGEILLDAASAEQLGAEIEIIEWRADENTRERFAVLAIPAQFSLRAPALPESPSPEIPPLSEEQLKPWILASVLERARAEGQMFLTELRPVVALFARFQGIDYDGDAAAGEKLNQLIARAQQILARYGGALLELTIGDKGSYFYATFGVPHVHEDDASRAVYAARELFKLCAELGFLEPLQIGISQGVMRVGAYGGHTRSTYGAQGDEVNLAARLMTRAAPGELLISGRIQNAVAGEFDLEPLAPLQLKGKQEPLLPFLVLGLRETRLQEFQEAYYSLPMIGRDAELARVQENLAWARRGHGQVIGITAPAGMGKSRLTAEIIRSVRRRSEPSYGGECQSFGTNIAYFVWAPLWRAFFSIDPKLPARRQTRALESQVAELAPERLPALPLLGALVQVPIAENDFTRALEPEFRKSALEALLLDCVRAAADDARAQQQLLLFVIEDAHWIDPASRALLELLAASIENLPVVILLTYRPPETDDENWPSLTALPHFTEITLTELTAAQGEGLIRAKLAQHTPENTLAIPGALIARLNAHAQGNPFYIEQLLDYLHDRGINVRDADAVNAIELPNTLHRLILSRMDQLNEQQQLTLKAASIIGRWFSVAHLCGYFPQVGSPERVRAELDRMQQYDLTALEQPEPELAYLFKHMVTQQVAYEALAYSTRATLHEAYAHFLETYDDPARALDVIAFHYDRSENLPKRREYLRRAGQAAAARFANAEAVDYITRALALTPASDVRERCVLLTARERVFDVMGERAKQRADLQERAALALELQDTHEQITVALRQGWLAERTGVYPEALTAAEKALALMGKDRVEPQAEQRLRGEAYALWGQALWEQGEPRAAQETLQRALDYARAGEDLANQARVLNLLGTIWRHLGEFRRARDLHAQALGFAHAAQDRRREYWTLNNLAAVAQTIGDLKQAIGYYTDALEIVHEIGDRSGQAALLSNLAAAYTAHGEYDRALEVYAQALDAATSVGDRKNVWRVLINSGETYRILGAYENAQTYTERALQLAKELGDRLGEGLALVNLGAIELARGELDAAQAVAERALEITRATARRESEAFVLNTLGQIALERNERAEAARHFEQAVQIWETLEPLPEALDAYAGLAQLALERVEKQTAHGYAEKIMAYLDAHPEQAGDPAALASALVTYRVFANENDARGESILQNARDALAARAEKMSDLTSRRSFLENVRANRELMRTPNAAAP